LKASNTFKVRALCSILGKGGKYSLTIECFSPCPLLVQNAAVQDGFNVFSGNLIDSNSEIAGRGIVHCVKASPTLAGVCWLEYTIRDVEGYGQGVLTAFGSLPVAPSSPGEAVKMTLTVTGFRGDFLVTGKSGGLIDIFLTQGTGGPITTELFSTIVLIAY
jgi:hypothetical protein